MKSFEKETIRKQLKDESQCLKDLEKAYEKARKDCQEQLRRLNSRKDMQNLQSIIYQKKYQTALLKQIDGVLNDLQTHTYKTANEFFQGSYQNGYIGSMYELQKQGIPFTIPIDPKKMVTAIQTDSKISKDYYLGKGLTVQNIRTLKKQIALDCTRGIASGLGWLEVAESLAVQKRFQIDLSDAMRIARTEGNRINQQARLDAGDEAVQNGCDILKQWDATLDGVTRPAHQEADGQIREWGEDFDVMGEKLPAPSVGGSASNVCNCRCQLLKRPRWALDDEELQILKDRAGFYGLDKTKNFEEYKEKFLKLPPVPVQVQVVQKMDNDELKQSDYLDERTTKENELKQTRIEWQNARTSYRISGTEKGKIKAQTEIERLSDKIDRLEKEIAELNKKYFKVLYQPENISGVKPEEWMTFDKADTYHVNPDYGTSGGYAINCQSCVVTFEARLRGYDVKVLPNTNGSVLDDLSRVTNLAWVDPSTGKHPSYIRDDSADTPKKYLKFLQDTIGKNGERYTIEFGWKGRSRGGHIVNLDRNENGELRIKDNQRGQGERSEWIGDNQVLSYLSRMKYSTTLYGNKIPTVPKVLRIDNMGFDLNIVPKIMKAGS